MCAFNDLIRDLEVADIPLSNRAYTWSSKRQNPVFSKLDRFFLSTDWSLNFPKIELKALEMIVSDHVPLLLTCKGNAPKPSPTRMETFWFAYKEVEKKLCEIWSNLPCSNSLQVFHNNTNRLHKELGHGIGSSSGRPTINYNYAGKPFYSWTRQRRRLRLLKVSSN